MIRPAYAQVVAYVSYFGKVPTYHVMNSKFIYNQQFYNSLENNMKI